MGYQDYCPLCGMGFSDSWNFEKEYRQYEMGILNSETMRKKYGPFFPPKTDISATEKKKYERVIKTVDKLSAKRKLNWMLETVGLQSGKDIQHYNSAMYFKLANSDDVIVSPAFWHELPLSDYPRFMLVMHKSCWKIAKPLVWEIIRNNDKLGMFHVYMVRYLLSMDNFNRMPPPVQFYNYQDQDPKMFQKDSGRLTLPSWHYDDPLHSQKQQRLIKKVLKGLKQFYNKRYFGRNTC